jgi:hypothetical protein
MASLKRFKGKKLLVASLGVAAVSYVGCSGPATSGNLVGPPPCEAGSCGGGGGAGGASPDGGTPDANSAG